MVATSYKLNDTILEELYNHWKDSRRQHSSDVAPIQKWYERSIPFKISNIHPNFKAAEYLTYNHEHFICNMAVLV
jgi:hypothetical protein